MSADRRASRRRFEPAPLVDRMVVPILGFLMGGLVGFAFADLLTTALADGMCALLVIVPVTPLVWVIALRYPISIALCGAAGAWWFWRRAAVRGDEPGKRVGRRRDGA